MENNIEEALNSFTDLKKKRTKNIPVKKLKHTKVTDTSESMLTPGTKGNRIHIKIHFDGELKRTINAFQIIKELNSTTATKPANIFTLITHHS